MIRGGFFLLGWVTRGEIYFLSKYFGICDPVLRPDVELQRKVIAMNWCVGNVLNTREPKYTRRDANTRK